MKLTWISVRFSTTLIISFWILGAQFVCSQIANRKDSLNTLLWYSACLQDYESMKIFLERGAYVNHKRQGNAMSIFPTVLSGDVSMAKLLYKYGAKIDAKTVQGLGLMHLSPSSGMTKWLLSKNLRTDNLASGNWYPFHYACLNGNLSQAKALHKNRLDIISKTSTGDTPLILATKSQNTDLIKFLLKNGADPLAYNKDGMQAIHFAHDQYAVKELIRYDTNFTVLDASKKNPLDYALEKQSFTSLKYMFSIHPKLSEFKRQPYLLKSIRMGRMDVAEWMIRNDFDIHATLEDNETPLHEATSADNIKIMQLLLEKKANPNAMSKDKKTPIHYIKSPEAAQLLLKYGGDLEGITLKGASALHNAAKSGNTKLVKWLLDHNVQTNKIDEQGNIPLYYAANFEIANLLVKKNSWIDSASKISGYTPLMNAANSDIAKLLLSKYASGTKTALNGQTALMRAIIDGRLDVATYLINNGSRINAIDSTGKTALYYATENDYPTMVKLLLERKAKTEIEDAKPVLGGVKSYDVARMLLGKGASLKVKYDLKSSVWSQIIELDNVTMMKLYLEKAKDFGFNINFIDAQGYGLLHLCIEKNATACFQALIDADADINLRDGNESEENSGGSGDFWSRFHQKHSVTQTGDTPLHLAIRFMRTNFTQKLLDLNVDVNLKNMSGETPLMLAVQKKMSELTRELVKKGAEIDTRTNQGHTAMFYSNSPDLSKFLLDLNADVNSKSIEGRTPLHKAAFLGEITLVRFMLAKGADSEVSDIRFGTPAHVALRYKHIDVARALIAAGNSINIKNIKEETPLHLAVQIPNLEIVQTILSRNSTMEYINAINADNDTPLTLAFEAPANHPDYFPTIKYLIEHGAKVNAPKSQVAPLALAVSRYDIKNDSSTVELVNYLLKMGADSNGDNINTNENSLHIALLVLDNLLDTTKVCPYGIQTIVEKLIESGVNVNIQGRKGTPLHHAITIYGNRYKYDFISFNIIVRLVQAGANVNATDKSGNTPLHKAIISQDEILTQLILAKKPKFNIVNKDGFTPLKLAKIRGHVKITDMLIKAGAKE